MNMNKKISRVPVGYTVAGVIALSGGATAVGRVVGVPGQSVSKWTKIPNRYIRQVAGLSGLTIEILRPDIFVAAV